MSLRFPGASVGTETWPQDDVHKQVTNYKLHPPPHAALQSGPQPQLPSSYTGKRCRPGSGEGSL